MSTSWYPLIEVLKQISPVAVLGAPNASPRNNLPSSKASIADIIEYSFSLPCPSPQIPKQKAPQHLSRRFLEKMPRASRHGPIPDPLRTRADDRHGWRGLPIKACLCRTQLSLLVIVNTVRGLDRLLELPRANSFALRKIYPRRTAPSSAFA